MKGAVVAFLALAVLGTGTALASDPPPKFKVFGGFSYVAPLGEEDVTLGTVRDSVKASRHLGWTVGLEARFNQLMGLEFDYVNATNDVKFGGRTVGDVHMQPLSATLNFHLIPSRKVDFYIGPTVSYFIFGDVDLGSAGGGTFNTDNEFAGGASAGLEIGLGDTVAIMGGIRYLNVDIKPDGAPNIPVDPLFSRLGLAFRW